MAHRCANESPWNAIIKLIGPLFAALITVSCFILTNMEVVPDRIISSIGIIIGLVIIGFLYGWISIPSIIAGVCYIPSLAFFWAWINNANYINFMNHWLQDDLHFVNYSVFSSFIAMSSTFAILLSVRKKKLANNVMMTTRSTRLSEHLFVISTFLAGFFFWLTDPGGTIITTSYTELLQQRYEGTQFAGALGLLCWLMSYMTYLSVGKRSLIRQNKFFFGRIIFIIVTVFSVLWLLLHARRSELSGMFMLMLLVVVEKKGIKRALLYFGIMLVLLITVEKIRTASLMEVLSGGMSLSSNISISSLPGGASNVFMSFVDVVHYYSKHSLLHGETFINYLFQILPTNIYNLADISKPPFFQDYGVFDNYDWNGGVNGMSIFYANFGIIGLVMYGILVGIYIIISTKALRSRKLTIKVIGAYLVAIALRGFWYEYITIIKPVLFLLIVHVVFYKSRTRSFALA